ncbi:hypothetical protein E9993_16970 [Labilibacter sediminis]|nr:hypothetical protein E9993_16970 [Labilibacter sediminis]
MDLTQFDIDGLQRLHIGCQNILKDHKNQLDELPQDEFSDIMTEVLRQKIASFETQIVLIEERIREINAEKLRFSTEFMFWNYGIHQRSVQVHFLTTSNAYKVYGPYVTGQVLFDKSKLQELIEKVEAKGHSDGKITFEEIVSNEMPEDVKEKLRTEGFYASEISLIY